MSWKKEVDEINRHRTLAKAQGGVAAIDKHHGRGKLTVRERIDAVLDGGSFREMGQMAGRAYLDEAGKVERFDPANYVLGLGQVDGRTVAIGGEDFTLKGGSPNAAGLRRSVYAEQLACDYQVPLIRLLEGGGGSVASGDNDARKPRTVGSSVYDPPRFQIMAKAMGQVPVVSAALGPVAGFPAGRLVASHFSVMTRDTSQVMTGGPALVQRALGQQLSKDDLGGAAVHAKSGVVDNIADSELDAFAQMRRFLSYLPSHVDERAPRSACDDPVDRCEDSLLAAVPRNRRRAFDVRKIIQAVVDSASFFQIAAGFGPRLELEEKLAASRTPYPAAESFAVHDLIDPGETRPRLCEWVDWIQPRLGKMRGPTKFGPRP